MKKKLEKKNKNIAFQIVKKEENCLKEENINKKSVVG